MAVSAVYLHIYRKHSETFLFSSLPLCNILLLLHLTSHGPRGRSGSGVVYICMRQVHQESNTLFCTTRYIGRQKNKQAQPGVLALPSTHL